MYGSDGFLPKQVVVFVGLQFAVISFGDGCHYGIGYGCQLVMIAQRIAVHHSRTHFFFGHQAECFHTVYHIVERTALRERYIAVGAYCFVGTV